MNLFDGRLTPADLPQAPQAKGLRLDDCVTRNTVQGTQEAMRTVSLALARLVDARRAYERAGADLDAASDAYAAAQRALHA